MANEEHLDMLKQGVTAWNAWRRANPDVRPDLTHAHLTHAHLRVAHLTGADLTDANLNRAVLNRAVLIGADLPYANLTQANLIEANLAHAHLNRANLTHAHLSGAVLQWADLRWADLIEAYLTEAYLTEANLTRANLTRANLGGAQLSGAQLSGADLSGADIGGTVFINNDLSSITGLETVVHHSPSSIGVDTLYRSEGKIPEAFLRGCGVPDSLIAYLPSLIGAMEPIQFYSCFISYSTKDEALAQRLHADLQSQHVRVWFAPEDLKIGDKIRTGIDESIRVSDKLLLILSKDSIASQWVEQEVESALAKERKENRLVLFPIRVDNAIMEIAGAGRR